MPLRMVLGSSGITSLRDLEVPWLGVPMLLAGFSARMECKFLLQALTPPPEKYLMKRKRKLGCFIF